MTVEATKNVETYVSVLKDILGLVTVKEGEEGRFCRNSLLTLTIEEVLAKLSWSSMTFEESLISSLYQGHPQEQIPEWVDSDSVIRILTTFFMRCEVPDKDLKGRLQTEFPEDSENNLKYKTIKYLVKKQPGNHGVKTIMHEYLAIGVKTSDFIIKKLKSWTEMKESYDEYQAKRKRFQNMVNTEGTTVEALTECYYSIAASLQKTNKKLKAFLTLRIQKIVDHLKPQDIMEMWNFKEKIALADDLIDIVDDKQSLYDQLFYLRSTMDPEHYFNDIRTMILHDRNIFDNFKTRALNNPTPPPDRLNNSSDQTNTGTSRETLRRQHSNNAQERATLTKNYIEEKGLEEIEKADEIIQAFPTQPDKIYEGKVLVALSSLENLLRETTKEERTSTERFVLYFDINNRREGGESLTMILRQRIEQLQTCKLSLSELDKKHARKKEDRLQLLNTFKIKKIVHPQDFLTWEQDFSSFMEKIFSDKILDPEEDNIQQKLLNKLEATIPADKLKQLDHLKTAQEKINLFISFYKNDVVLLVEKIIKDILKLKNPENDEKISYKNMEVYIQKIDQLVKKDCLYLITKDHLDQFPRKLFVTFTLKRYNNSIPKFRNLNEQEQAKFLETGDMTLLEVYKNVIQNNTLLNNLKRNFMPENANDGTRRTSLMSQGITGQRLATAGASSNPVEQIKTSLKQVESSLNQSRLNTNNDKHFYFLMVFCVKEHETLLEKLSSSNMLTEISKESKSPKNPSNQQKEGSPKKKTVRLSKSKRDKKVLMTKQPSQAQAYKKGKSFDKPSKPFKPKSKKTPPYLLCPIGCRNKEQQIHKVKWGSAAFCRQFLNMNLGQREAIVKAKPDLLKCCLRNSKGELGHEPKDRKNCKMKKCRFCGRWGHSSLLCKDPKSGNTKTKSVKLTHKENDSTSDEENQDNETDEEQEETGIADSEEETNETDNENENRDESEADSNDDKDSQESETEKSNNDSENEYETDENETTSEDEDQHQLKLMRKVLMLKIQQNNESEPSSTERRQPTRKCKKGFEFTYLNEFKLPRSMRRPRKRTKTLWKPKRNSERWVNEIIHNKIMDIMHTEIKSGTILDTLIRANKKRVEEITKLGLICQKLSSQENNYIKLLVSSADKQKKTKPKQMKKQDFSSQTPCNPVCTEETTNDETNPVTSMETHDFNNSSQRSDNNSPDIEEILKPKYPGLHIFQKVIGNQSNEDYQTGDSTTEDYEPDTSSDEEYYDEINIFNTKFIQTYGDDEDNRVALEMHSQNLVEIIKEKGSLLQIIETIDKNTTKLEEAMEVIMKNSNYAQQMNRNDLKVLTNIFIHMKRNTVNLEQRSDEEELSTGIQPEPEAINGSIRMLRRSPITECNFDLVDDNKYYNNDHESEKTAMRKAIFEIVSDREKHFNIDIEDRLENLCYHEEKGNITRFNNTSVSYKPEPSKTMERYSPSERITTHITLSVEERTLRQLLQDQPKYSSKFKYIILHPVPLWNPKPYDCQKRYQFVAELLHYSNNARTPYVLCEDSWQDDFSKVINTRNRGLKFFRIEVIESKTWQDESDLWFICGFDTYSTLKINTLRLWNQEPRLEVEYHSKGEHRIREDECPTEVTLRKLYGKDFLYLINKSTIDENTSAINMFWKEYKEVYGSDEDFMHVLKTLKIITPGPCASKINYLLELVADTKHSTILTYQALRQNFQLEDKRYNGILWVISKVLLSILWKIVNESVEQEEDKMKRREDARWRNELRQELQDLFRDQIDKNAEILDVKLIDISSDSDEEIENPTKKVPTSIGQICSGVLESKRKENITVVPTAYETFEEEYHRIYGSESDFTEVLEIIGMTGPYKYSMNHFLKMIMPTKYSSNFTFYELRKKFNLYDDRYQGPLRAISKVLHNILWEEIIKKSDEEVMKSHLETWGVDLLEEDLESTLERNSPDMDDELEDELSECMELFRNITLIGEAVCIKCNLTKSECEKFPRVKKENEMAAIRESQLAKIMEQDLITRIKSFTYFKNFTVNPQEVQGIIRRFINKMQKEIEDESKMSGIDFLYQNYEDFTFYDADGSGTQVTVKIWTKRVPQMKLNLDMTLPDHEWHSVHDPWNSNNWNTKSSILMVHSQPDQDCHRRDMIWGKITEYHKSRRQLVTFWDPVKEIYDSINLSGIGGLHYFIFSCFYVLTYESDEYEEDKESAMKLRLLRKMDDNSDNDDPDDPDEPMEEYTPNSSENENESEDENEAAEHEANQRGFHQEYLMTEASVGWGLNREKNDTPPIDTIGEETEDKSEDDENIDYLFTEPSYRNQTAIHKSDSFKFLRTIPAEVYPSSIKNVLFSILPSSKLHDLIFNYRNSGWPGKGKNTSYLQLYYTNYELSNIVRSVVHENKMMMKDNIRIIECTPLMASALGTHYLHEFELFYYTQKALSMCTDINVYKDIFGINYNQEHVKIFTKEQEQTMRAYPRVTTSFIQYFKSLGFYDPLKKMFRIKPQLKSFLMAYSNIDKNKETFSWIEIIQAVRNSFNNYTGWRSDEENKFILHLNTGVYQNLFKCKIVHITQIESLILPHVILERVNTNKRPREEEDKEEDQPKNKKQKESNTKDNISIEEVDSVGTVVIKIDGKLQFKGSRFHSSFLDALKKANQSIEDAENSTTKNSEPQNIVLPGLSVSKPNTRLLPPCTDCSKKEVQKSELNATLEQVIKAPEQAAKFLDEKFKREKIMIENRRATGFQTLGAYKVSSVNNLLSIKGPDTNRCREILSKLTNREAKICKLGGKECLIFLAPEEGQKPPIILPIVGTNITGSRPGQNVVITASNFGDFASIPHQGIPETIVNQQNPANNDKNSLKEVKLVGNNKILETITLQDHAFSSSISAPVFTHTFTNETNEKVTYTVHPPIEVEEATDEILQTAGEQMQENKAGSNSKEKTPPEEPEKVESEPEKPMVQVKMEIKEEIGTLDGDLNLLMVNRIHDLQQSDCDEIMSWCSFYNFRDNSSLTTFIQKAKGDEIREQYQFQEIFDCIVDYIRENSLFDASNPTIVLADQELELAIGQRMFHYKEIQMLIHQHTNLFQDYKLKIMREKVGLATGALYKALDEERAKRIITRFLCNKYNVAYDIEYENHFSKDTHPTCNITTVTDTIVLGMVPLTRPVSHQEREELKMRLSLATYPDRGTARSDVLGLSDLDANLGEVLVTHRRQKDKQVQPYFVNSLIPSDYFMLSVLSGKLSYLPPKERNEPYIYYPHQVDNFLSFAEIDYLKAKEHQEKVILGSPGRRKKDGKLYKYLNIIAEIPEDHTLCKLREFKEIIHTPFNFKILNKPNRRKYACEIGIHMTEDVTRTEEEIIEEMMKLGKKLNYGTMVYEQVERFLKEYKTCFNCSLQPPVRCTAKCTNDNEHMVCLSKKYLTSIGDRRVQDKTKPEPYWLKTEKVLKRLELNNDNVKYESVNFETPELEADKTYKNRRKDKLNRISFLSAWKTYAKQRGHNFKGPPAEFYKRSPHILDPHCIPMKVHGKVSMTNSFQEVHHRVWKQQTEFPKHEYLGVNGGIYHPKTPPYVTEPKTNETVTENNSTRYREDPSKSRAKYWQKYCLEYQPDRIFSKNCWWDPQLQAVKPHYLAKPLDPTKVRVNILHLKPQFQRFFRMKQNSIRHTKIHGEKLIWDLKSKYLSYSSLIEALTRYLVLIRIKQTHANVLIVNLQEDELGSLLEIKTMHAHQMQYYAQLMIEDVEAPPSYDDDLESTILQRNILHGMQNHIEEPPGHIGEEPADHEQEEGESHGGMNVFEAPFPTTEDEGYGEGETEDPEINHAKKICMVKKLEEKDEITTPRIHEESDDEASSIAVNIGESDEEADPCKGMEKATFHRYLNDVGPEMEEIAKFTSEKINGFHTGYDKEIQQRLKLDREKSKESTDTHLPKKACKALPDNDNDERPSIRRVFKATENLTAASLRIDVKSKIEGLNEEPLLLGNQSITFLDSKHHQYQKIIDEGNILYNSKQRIVSEGFDIRLERPKNANEKECAKEGWNPGRHSGINDITVRCISDTGANSSVGDAKLLKLGIAKKVHGKEETFITAGNSTIKATPAMVKAVLRDGKKISLPISLVQEVGGGTDSQISEIQEDIYSAIFGITKDLRKYFNFKKRTSKTIILLGTDNSIVQSTPLTFTQLEEFGFKVPSVSPNSNIMHNPLGNVPFSISGTLGINQGLGSKDILIPIGNNRSVTVPITNSIKVKNGNPNEYKMKVTGVMEIEIKDKENISPHSKPAKLKKNEKKIRHLRKEKVDCEMLSNIMKIAGNDGIHEFNQDQEDQSLWLGSVDEDLIWNTILLENSFSELALEEEENQPKGSILMIKKVQETERNVCLKTDKDGNFTLKRDMKLGVEISNKGLVLKVTKNQEKEKKHQDKITISEQKANDIMYMFLQQMLMENSFPTMPRICLEHSITINTCSKCNNKKKISEKDEILYDTIKRSARKIVQRDKEGKEQIKYQFDLITQGNNAKEDLFAPEKTNMYTVKRETERLIKKLKKESLLEAFNKNIVDSREKGFLIKLTKKEEEDLKKQAHYFVSLNYACNPHSKTTPVRPVTDTSRQLKGTTTSHSKLFISPPGFLNNIEGCHRQATFYENAAALDIQKAYLQLKMSEEDARFTLILWKEDPADESSPWIILRYNSFSFGNSQSSSVLHILVTEFGAGNCDTELGKVILTKFSLADDILTSYPNIENLLETTSDIMQALHLVGLPCKPPMVSAAAQPQNILNPEVNYQEDSFGMRRDYLTNSYQPSTRLSLYGSKRGKPLGKSLKEMSYQEIDEENITKKHLLRITAECYDISQKFYAPVIMNGKILFRHIHTILPHDSQYNTPIKSVSKILDQHVKEFLKELRDFSENVGRKPVWCVPSGYTPCSFIVSTDGSITSTAVVLHVISEKDDPNAVGPPIYSGLYQSKQQLNSKSTSSISEMVSIKQGIMLIMGVLEDVRHLIKSEFDVYLLNDNSRMSNHFNPSKGTAKTIERNVVNSVKAGLLWMSNYPFLKFIRVAFVSGHLSIADLCSKYSKNMTMIVKSIKWNHGIPQYLQRELFNDTTFIYQDKDVGYQYTQLPEDLHDPKDPKLQFLVPPKKKRKLEKLKEISPQPSSNLISTQENQAVKNTANEMDSMNKIRMSKLCQKENDIKSESFDDYLYNKLYCTSTIDENTSCNDLASVAAYYPELFNNKEYPHFLKTTQRAGARDIKNNSNFINTIFERKVDKQIKGKINAITRKQARAREKNESSKHTKIPSISQVAKEDDSSMQKDDSHKSDPQISQDGQQSKENEYSEVSNWLAKSIPESDIQSEDSKHEQSWIKNLSDIQDNLSSISKNHQSRANKLNAKCLERFGYNLSNPLDTENRIASIIQWISQFDVMRPNKGSGNLIQEKVDSIFKGHLDKETYLIVIKRYSNARRTFRVILSVMIAIIRWKEILLQIRAQRGNSLKVNQEPDDQFSEPKDQYLPSEVTGQVKPVNNSIEELLHTPSIPVFIERTNKLGELDPFVLYHEAWALLLRSDQKHFPLAKRTEKDITMTLSGVKVLKNRMDSIQAAKLFGSDCLPVLEKNSPLLYLKLIIAHQRNELDYENPVKFWIGVHADKISTQINLKTGNTGINCVNIKTAVNYFCKFCAPCKRTENQYFKSFLGRQMHSLDHGTPIFQRISIDPAHPMWVFPNLNSRKPIRIYLLAIACLTTFATRLIPIPNLTLKAMKLALQQLQLQTMTPLTFVHTDHGTQFAGKLKEILPGVKIKHSHRLSQRTNYVENRIRLGKKVMKRIFQKTSREKMDIKIDLFTLQIIILIVENCVNSLPFNSRAGTSGITPDHFLHPFQFIKRTLNQDNDDPSDEISTEKKVKNYFKNIIEIRNKEILTEERRFRAQKGKEGDFEIRIGDIVFVKNNDYSKIKIGRVEKISDSGNTVTVYFSSSKKSKCYNVQDLHPLTIER